MDCSRQHTCTGTDSSVTVFVCACTAKECLCIMVVESEGQTEKVGAVSNNPLEQKGFRQVSRRQERSENSSSSHCFHRAGASICVELIVNVHERTILLIATDWMFGSSGLVPFEDPRTKLVVYSRLFGGQLWEHKKGASLW